MRTRWENTTENGQLCRALRKTGWTRPLGTTAGAPEDRPGDLRTGTGVDRRDFSPGGRLPPTENKQTKQRREALDEPDASPPPSSPPRFSSACPLLFPPLFPLLLLLSAPQEGAATHRQCRCSPRRIYPRRCLFLFCCCFVFSTDR